MRRLTSQVEKYLGLQENSKSTGAKRLNSWRNPLYVSVIDTPHNQVASHQTFPDEPGEEE